jgi:LacI family transcriptional regulator
MRLPHRQASPIFCDLRLRLLLLQVSGSWLQIWRIVVGASTPPTLLQVARLANVSIATASRVLNDGPRPTTAESRRRVLEAAARLNYRPNAAARAVARGHADIVGLILHDVTDPYFSAVAASILSAADSHGVTTMVADTRSNSAREAGILALLHEQRTRGVIIVGSRTTDRAQERQLEQEIAAFTAVGGRVVMISERVPHVSTVTVENSAGARALARALWELGHRQFAILSGPPGVRTSRDRVQGFRRGLAERGIELGPDRIFCNAFYRDGGYRAALEWHSSSIPATCLFAVNDVMAIGAMAALRSRGVRVPEDVSVAGFDDIPSFADFTPSLTTVRIPLDRLGAEAVALVLEQDVPDGGLVRTFRGEVILRDSTRTIDDTIG